MSRLEREWAIVPTAARWIAVLAALAYTALMAAIFLLPAAAAGDTRALYALGPIFLLSVLGAVPIALWVLLIGYIYVDGALAIVTATDLSTPLSSWTVVLSDVFDGSGSYTTSIPIDVNTANRFYAIRAE